MASLLWCMRSKWLECRVSKFDSGRYYHPCEQSVNGNPALRMRMTKRRYVDMYFGTRRYDMKVFNSEYSEILWGFFLVEKKRNKECAVSPVRTSTKILLSATGNRQNTLDNQI